MQTSAVPSQESTFHLPFLGTLLTIGKRNACWTHFLCDHFILRGQGRNRLYAAQHVKCYRVDKCSAIRVKIKHLCLKWSVLQVSDAVWQGK